MWHRALLLVTNGSSDKLEIFFSIKKKKKSDVTSNGSSDKLEILFSIKKKKKSYVTSKGSSDKLKSFNRTQPQLVVAIFQKKNKRLVHRKETKILLILKSQNF